MEGLFTKVWARCRENRWLGGTLSLVSSRAVSGPRLEGVSYRTQKAQNHAEMSVLTYFKKNWIIVNLGFPGDSAVKNPLCQAGDAGLIPGLGRPSGEGNGNPLQYSCLGNPMDRGAWQATVQKVTKELGATERLNNKIVNVQHYNRILY